MVNIADVTVVVCTLLGFTVENLQHSCSMKRICVDPQSQLSFISVEAKLKEANKLQNSREVKTITSKCI